MRVGGSEEVDCVAACGSGWGRGGRGFPSFEDARHGGFGIGRRGGGGGCGLEYVGFMEVHAGDSW